MNTSHRVAMRLQALEPDQPCGDAALHAVLAGADDGARGSGQVPACLLAMVDGLGHGAAAAEAAHAAVQLLQAQCAAPSGPAALPMLLRLLDDALVATRGAAVGLAMIEGTQMRYAGIGNTRAMRWRAGHLMRLSSQYGIVGGGQAPNAQVTEIDLQPGDWLLLFTDGLDERVELPVLLPEWQRDPALLCEHLLERWRSVPADDAGVLVCSVGAA